jgi:hypothetical protein
MELNPIRFFRRRARLGRAVKEEVEYLRRRYGEKAYQAALKEADRSDLTSWGREVMRAAAEQLRPREEKPGAKAFKAEG